MCISFGVLAWVKCGLEHGKKRKEKRTLTPSLWLIYRDREKLTLVSDFPAVDPSRH
jgi:hypothetical protein